MLIRFIIGLQTLTMSAALAAKDIALEETPPEVLETAISTAPGIDFTRVTVEEENGRRIFEFEGRGSSGEHMEIDVFEDGTLEEIEIEIGESAIPAPVRAALDRAEPGLVIAYVETSIRTDGIFVYEIEGKTAGGDAVSIDIREDGAVLSRERAAVS